MSINANQSAKGVNHSIAELSSQLMLKTKYIVAKQSEEQKKPDLHKIMHQKRKKSIEIKTDIMLLE